MRFFSPLRLVLLGLLVGGAALGADVLPSAGKSVGFVRDDTPGFWLVLSADLSPVDAKFFEGDDKAGYRGCVFEGGAGRYMAIKIENGRPKPFPVVLGGVAPPVVVPPRPVPPDEIPDPPGPEVPPVPPVVAGPRQVLILRESANDTPAMARLINSLQAGKGREYLRSKGHSAFVLDVDAKDASGNVPANVAAWKAAIGTVLPAVAILDDNGAILVKSHVADGMTADDVLTLLKGHGG